MNSLKKSVNSIHISRGRSLNLCIFFGFICFSACLSLLLLGLSGHPWLYTLIPLLLWRCITGIKQHALLTGHNPIITIHRDSGNVWSIIRADHSETDVSLSGNSFLSRQFMVMAFKEPRRWFATPVIIMPDSMDREIFRRVLVLLRTSSTA